MNSALFISALVLGAGLAIDVLIATLARFRDRSLTFTAWTIPVIVLHILFIASSYLLSLGVTQKFPVFQPAIGVIGFILVMWLVNKVTREALGQEHQSHVMNWLKRLGVSEDSANRKIVLVAITLDALISGPVIQPWISNLSSLADISFFFLSVGMGVGIVTQIAVWISARLRKRHFHSAESMARWFTQAKYVELSVIGGFGISAPWESIWGNSNLLLSILLMAVIMGLIWFPNYQAIYENELSEATEAIEG